MSSRLARGNTNRAFLRGMGSVLSLGYPYRLGNKYGSLRGDALRIGHDWRTVGRDLDWARKHPDEPQGLHS